MNILLFDRSLDIRFHIARNIEQLCSKCNISSFSDIHSTLLEMEINTFNIIIIDLDFIGERFNELMNILKTVSPNCKLILLTFYPDENVKNKFISKGANYYFDKTSQFTDLIKLIKNLSDSFVSDLNSTPLITDSTI